MNTQQLSRALHELEAERVPADLDLWPRVRARLVAQPGEVRRGRWLPVTRLGWVAVALVALLAVGATARVAATAPVIGRLLQLFEPEIAHQDDSASLGQALNLSQAIDNVTVAVEWAYADAQRIRVGYTLRSSDGRRFDPCHMTLTDETGAPMPFAMGYGVTGEAERLDVALPPGEGSYVSVFANEAQGVAPGELLKLRLEAEAEELILPTPVPTSVPAAPGGPAANPKPGSVLLEPLPVGERLGPFVFEFSIPVAASSAK
ncbi:MAG TPA: DUF4179 domain-containing protein [Anaerolineae bacterium]|nr:DUF4179 domain-containing protein [Anaerolineae bacterium]HPL28303.1 DUF4179 domain-containing protein [Anaerolineae bacterium]